MNVSVMGLGLVSKAGSAAELVQRLTAQRRIDPAELTQGRSLALEVPSELPGAAQLTRRMSHFAKLSLSSAWQALQDAEFDPAGKSIGIIQGTVYGPIISGLQAYDDLIDFGDNQLSPTHFSGSVFNTAATYLSLAFGIQGCTLSHTSGFDTLYTSLLTAALWLENRTVDYVLLGVGDEYTAYFDQALPLETAAGLLPTGEGWTTLLLSREPEAKYGRIHFLSHSAFPEQPPNQRVIYSVWHEQLKPRFTKQLESCPACWPAPLRGSYPSAAAFDLALAILCAKYGKLPVMDAARGDYQVVTLSLGEPVHCYSCSADNAVAEYEIRSNS